MVLIGYATRSNQMKVVQFFTLDLFLYDEGKNAGERTFCFCGFIAETLRGLV